MESLMDSSEQNQERNASEVHLSSQVWLLIQHLCFFSPDTSEFWVSELAANLKVGPRSMKSLWHFKKPSWRFSTTLRADSGARGAKSMPVDDRTIHMKPLHYLYLGWVKARKQPWFPMKTFPTKPGRWNYNLKTFEDLENKWNWDMITQQTCLTYVYIYIYA